MDGWKQGLLSEEMLVGLVGYKVSVLCSASCVMVTGV
jgi:hypothetical protein